MEPHPGNSVIQAASIGLIYDRTAYGDEPLCSAFIIRDRVAVTIASILQPYIKHPNALKLRFPITGEEWGITAILPHPKFDQQLSAQSAQRGTLSFSAESALQRYNCAILGLDEELKFISESAIEEVSKSLRYPLELTSDGFTGSLGDIDLTLVLQTLNNGRKEGILYLCDPLTRPVAQIFCQNGRIASAKYGPLVNELALFQIIQRNLKGKFVFYPCAFPAWLPPKLIEMPSDGLLIEAYRRLDELTELAKPLKTHRTYFARKEKNCRADLVPGELREPAELLWRVLDANTPSDQLWLLAALDDFTIFKCLLELYRSGQILRRSGRGTQAQSLKPVSEPLLAPSQRVELKLSAEAALNPFDAIINLSFDSRSEQLRARTGSFLGAIDPHDSRHLLHDIPLLPSAAGTPIFKGNLVIGMHCGTVPNSVFVKNTPSILQQMLWVEAINECQKAHRKEQPSGQTAQAPPSTRATPDTGGCSEIASISCPGCGERTSDSARLCSNCNYQFVPDLAPEPLPTQIREIVTEKKSPLPLIVTAATLALLAVIGAGAYAFSLLPPVHTESPKLVHFQTPSQPWVDVTTMKAADEKLKTWAELPQNAEVKVNDSISFRIRALKPCFVYLYFIASGSDSGASCIFPPEGVANLCQANSEHMFPSREYPAPGGQGKLLDTYSVQGSGTDRVLIAAVPANQPPTLYPADLDQFFHEAERMLSKSTDGKGLVVPARELGSPQSAPGYPVYIAELRITH